MHEIIVEKLVCNNEAFLFLKQNGMKPYKYDFINNHICYIIKDKHNIIAHVSYVDEKIESQQYRFFYCLLVKEEYRKQGIAKKLIDFLETSSTIDKIDYICCFYYTKKQRFYYEKLGYIKSFGYNKQVYKKL